MRPLQPGEDGTVEMVLTVKERLVLLNLLPAEGNLVTLRLVREAREALSFSEEENAVLQFEQINDRLKWSDEAPQEAEVELGQTVVGMIRERLVALDKQAQMRDEHLSLCDKFGYLGGDG